MALEFLAIILVKDVKIGVVTAFINIDNAEALFLYKNCKKRRLYFLWSFASEPKWRLYHHVKVRNPATRYHALGVDATK